MNKSESAILEAKTPEEYIDRSLKAKLSPAAKARLARTWMESTGYSKEDILRARNRHPYWKQKKMEGSAERTRRRLAAHDYSGGSSVDWNRRLVTEFLSLNARDSSGHYELKDWQLAERFGATIPSIQYMRRKLRKVRDILGTRVSSEKVVDYLLRAESVLSRGKGAVEELQKSERSKSNATTTKSPTKGAALKSGAAAKHAAAPVARKAVARKAVAKSAGAKNRAAKSLGVKSRGSRAAATVGAVKNAAAKNASANKSGARSAIAGKGGPTAKRAPASVGRIAARGVASRATKRQG
ncbi:MAG: hypothetical protein ACLQMF_17665 [Rectinemataceae bacterium]